MRQSWKETLSMSAEEFFGMMAYVKVKRKKEQEAIKAAEGKMKIY